MAIVLTQYEKHSLIRFIGIYLISSFSLLSIIAFLIFSIQKKQIYENLHNQMLLKSSQIAQVVIFEHMSGKPSFHPSSLSSLQDFKYQITLFNSQKKPIYGKGQFIQSKTKFFIQDNQVFLLDNGAYGHLGVEWILIETNASDEIKTLIFYILLATSICFVFVAIFGVVLGKMFLKPVRDGISFLDCFIKDITHELNTPISAIIMSIGSLKQGVSEQKLLRIHKACKRIEFLYNNLTFLFLGEIQSTKEQIEFLGLLQNRIEMFENHLLEKNISLVFKQCEKSLSLYRQRSDDKND